MSEPSNIIFVSNIPKEIRARDLYTLFSDKISPVRSINVYISAQKGPYALIQCFSREQVKRAFGINLSFIYNSRCFDMYVEEYIPKLRRNHSPPPPPPRRKRFRSPCPRRRRSPCPSPSPRRDHHQQSPPRGRSPCPRRNHQQQSPPRGRSPCPRRDQQQSPRRDQQQSPRRDQSPLRSRSMSPCSSLKRRCRRESLSSTVSSSSSEMSHLTLSSLSSMI